MVLGRYRGSVQAPDVVTSVASQAQQAEGLRAVGDQELLDDPRTNPATRGYRDRLRDEQQRRALDMAHRRALRRDRVRDRQAAEAEAALEAIAAARQQLSPARAVTALQRGRARFLAGALAASILLSVGSALGLAAVSSFTGGPALAGWIAELCLTVATTAAILYRSHIDQADTVEAARRPAWQGWRGTVLGALVVAPLSASVCVNLAGWALGAPVSPINALCAVGAGVAGLFAFLVSEVSARAIRTNAEAVNAADEDALRRTAMGDHETAASGPECDAAGLADRLNGLDSATRHRVVAEALDGDAMTEAVAALEYRPLLDGAPPANDATARLDTEHSPDDAPEEEGRAPASGGQSGQPERDPGAPPATEEPTAGLQRARQARSHHAQRRRDEARTLWDQGLSVPEIAERMTRKRETVTGYLLDRDIDKDTMAQRTSGGAS